MPELHGRTAVVTGGTKGIGLAIAEALAAHGANVVVSARTAGDVERVARELDEGRFRTFAPPADAPRGAVRGVVCDVRSADACRRLIESAAAAFGGIDILVNNAGIGVFAPVDELSIEDWQRVIETNLNSAFYCSHYAIPHLRERGGWIINIGSLAGKNAFPRGAAYNASKFGLIGFAEAMMQDVRHDGIRVSTILPGSVATEFSHPTPGAGDDWKVRPEDIAEIVLDLLDTPARTLPSRVEVRPSRPPRK
ncbi:MAG TPA: SDR family oxidoreductase [Longimicrobiales bacterium]